MSLFSLALALQLQVTDAISFPEGVFSPDEAAKMERAEKIEKRIKVYDAASKRLQRSVETAITKEDFQTVPDKLRLWTSLLSKSLEDIESNLKTKKKPRELIKYEIQLRKSIARTESLKIRAPVDQQDIFDSSIAEAEKVRKRFVEILFRH